MTLPYRWSSTLLLAALGAATASELQIPLISQQSPSRAGSALGKPLVNTDDLQASIKIESLLERAKDLYGIAQKSEHEFGHPTRVIGSEGMYF